MNLGDDQELFSLVHIAITKNGSGSLYVVYRQDFDLSIIGIGQSKEEALINTIENLLDEKDKFQECIATYQRTKRKFLGKYNIEYDVHKMPFILDRLKDNDIFDPT